MDVFPALLQLCKFVIAPPDNEISALSRPPPAAVPALAVAVATFVIPVLTPVLW